MRQTPQLRLVPPHRRVRLGSMFLLTLHVVIGCGSKSSESSGDILAPVIASAANSGLVFAATNIEAEVRTSRIYYYGFATGKVHEVLPGESGNPALFFADNRAFLFNRQPDQKNFRSFDPRHPELTPSPAIELPALTDGDPWDIAPLVSGKSLLLAAPLGGTLQTLDYTSGELTAVPLPSGGLASKGIRPHALLRHGTNLYVLHSGVSASGVSDGSAQVYKLTVAGDGGLSFANVDASTGVATGTLFTGSNPVGFVNRDGQEAATIVALCAQEWQGCTAGATRLSGQAATPYGFSGGQPAVNYHNQVVDGPQNSVVYAHVRLPGDQYKVVKIDLTNNVVTAVHAFPDERLYGIAYDKTSRTLFVGGTGSGLKGNITLYRDDQVIGSFEVDGVLYDSAFVPN